MKLQEHQNSNLIQYCIKYLGTPFISKAFKARTVRNYMVQEKKSKTNRGRLGYFINNVMKQYLKEYSNLYFYNILEFKPCGIGSRIEDLVSFHLLFSKSTYIHTFFWLLYVSLVNDTSIESATYSVCDWPLTAMEAVRG